MNSISIRAFCPDDVPAVLAISDVQMGKDYLLADDLVDANDMTLVAVIEGRVVGFCTSPVFNRAELHERLPTSKLPALHYLSDLENFGLIESIATDQDFTRRGVGDQLMSASIVALEKQGIKAIWMTGMKSDAGVHVGSLASKHGFTPLAEIANYWADGAIPCATCSSPPCRCSVVVFLRSSHI